MGLCSIRQQFFIAGCLYLGQILVGFGLGWTSPMIPKLQDASTSPLPDLITDQEASWIGSMLYVGTVTGPYVSGFLSNVKGRKPCLFLGATICLLSFVVLALTSNLAMIYTGRILIGLGTGIIFVVNLVYIGEIASTHVRGVLLTCTGIFSTVGTLIVYTIGAYASYVLTNAIGIAITVVYILAIFFIPETPLFLVLKGREHEVRETLERLGRADDYDKIIKTKHEVTLRDENIKQQWTEIISIKSNKRALFITLTLNILQQMSGVIAVVFYATRIFELANSPIEPSFATIIIGVTQVVASIITPLFVERSGRRLLLLLSTAACCLSLTILGTYFFLDHIGDPVAETIGFVPLASLMIFFIAYDLGFGIIPSTFIGEMFTPNVRSTGSTVTITVAWLVGFAVSSLFSFMISFGPHVAFWVYAAASGVAFMFSIIFVPETKGKTLVEIQQMLSQSWIR